MPVSFILSLLDLCKLVSFDLNQIDLFADYSCLSLRDQSVLDIEEMMRLFADFAGKEQMILAHGIVLSVC